MGIRQTAQPLGVGLGALVIPRLARKPRDRSALLFPAVVCAVSAVVSAVGVLDPPRPPRAEAPPSDLANPYRGSSVLWRIHAVSVLLVVPQVVVWTFTLVWLMTDRGWSAGVGRRAGHRGPVARRARPGRGGPVVRPRRARGCGRSAPSPLAAAVAMGLLALTDWLTFAGQRRADGDRAR